MVQDGRETAVNITGNQLGAFPALLQLAFPIVRITQDVPKLLPVD